MATAVCHGRHLSARWCSPRRSSFSVNGPILFLSIGIGLVVLSRRLAGDARWCSLAGYTLGTGVALVIMFAASGFLVRPDDAPLHDYAGLAQRAVLAVRFSCLLVLAVRLFRLTNNADAAVGAAVGLAPHLS
jgi:hypothetical protein